MNKIVSVFSLLLLIGAGCSAAPVEQEQVSDGEAVEVTESRDRMPAFSFVDFNGNTVTNADFDGQYVVYNSWATWCPFCTKELPEFAFVQRQYQGQVRIVAIGRGERLERSKEFTDKIGVTNELLFLLDPRDTFYRSIGGFSMPETIFVNKKGEIVEHKRGPLSMEEFSRIVGKLVTDQL